MPPRKYCHIEFNSKRPEQLPKALLFLGLAEVPATFLKSSRRRGVLGINQGREAREVCYETTYKLS